MKDLEFGPHDLVRFGLQSSIRVKVLWHAALDRQYGESGGRVYFEKRFGIGG